MESKVFSESTCGTMSPDLEDQKRLSRGSICLSTESKGRIVVNQITTGGKEYSWQREQHMKDLSNKREQEHLKN